MAPSVSVVIPAFGHAGYILATLESVFAQSVPAFEVIVVDDGSPDDTAERIAPLAATGRIRLVRQPNAGVAAARNHGAALARGEYLLFLDDDDLLYPHALAALVAVAERQPALALVHGERVDFTVERPTRPPPATPSVVEPCTWSAFMGGNRIATPGQVLLRRDAFAALGGYDRSIWGADDWDLWLRLLRTYPGARVQTTVLAYRLHARNSSWNTRRMWDQVGVVMRRHLASAPAAERALLARRCVHWLRGYLRIQGERQLREAVRRGHWRGAATAGAMLVRMWLAEQRSRVVLGIQRLLHPRPDPVEQKLQHIV